MRLCRLTDPEHLQIGPTSGRLLLIDAVGLNIQISEVKVNAHVEVNFVKYCTLVFQISGSGGSAKRSSHGLPYKYTRIKQ